MTRRQKARDRLEAMRAASLAGGGEEAVWEWHSREEFAAPTPAILKAAEAGATVG